MTNEAKLLKLLQVAIDNGWKPVRKWLFVDKEMVITNNYLCFNRVMADKNKNPYFTELSLNDLVTNWEEGEISFIEALCKPTEYKVIFNGEPHVINSLKFDEEVAYIFNGNDQDFLPIVISIKLHWILQPTSQRVNWLFETFSHLL